MRFQSCFFFFQLPYPLLASLNGVALFAQSQDVTLLTTVTKDCKLLWRDYQNRYTLGNKLIQGIRTQIVKSNSSVREGRLRGKFDFIIDLLSRDMGICCQTTKNRLCHYFIKISIVQNNLYAKLFFQKSAVVCDPLREFYLEF